MPLTREEWKPYEEQTVDIACRVSHTSGDFMCCNDVRILDSSDLEDAVSLDLVNTSIPSTDHFWIGKQDRLYLNPLKGDMVVLIGATIGKYHKGWTVLTHSLNVVLVIKEDLIYECLHIKEGVHSFRLFGVESPFALQINAIQNPELNVAVRRAFMNLSVRGIWRLLEKLQEDIVVSEGQIEYDLFITGKGFLADSNVMFQRMRCFFRRVAEGKVPNYSLD